MFFIFFHAKSLDQAAHPSLEQVHLQNSVQLGAHDTTVYRADLALTLATYSWCFPRCTMA